ncbi:hypothetical protein [Flavivirga spongiicola]|uniref:Uncharacterized protein n=1 Tax=Flavivirga spongiicola TaxID=421621 RepID=A0ABU7XUE5_9FLAO|nr:hypothetical protein [Flavivirga sp. MEBiC05379]MDO5979197.1 hypothetical protein [Flavivirga sp. MEBiC05379]
MTKHIFRLILPLTLISFGLVTKWWFGIAIDAKDVFFEGFPLIYKCEGFHTSLSTQYFIFELFVNLMTYFLFWFVVTFLATRIWTINIPAKIVKVFWIGYGLLFLGFVFLSIDLNDLYLKKRNFEVEIFDTGISIFGNTPTDREKYQHQIKEHN